MRPSLNGVLLCLLLCAPARALVVEQPLPDPVQEASAQQLFHAMKCVVCEGQSLAESDALFAQQMRAQIRRMFGDGATPRDVRHYFTQRYGESILLNPPLSPRTGLLWAMPLLLLAIGAVILWRHHQPRG